MVVGIKLSDNGKTYYFNSNGYNLNEGDKVIVETEKGLQYGEVVISSVEGDKTNNLEYKNVIRIANKNDHKKHMNNLRDADKALVKCNDLINQYELDMKIIDVSYTFDREQLIFRFVSDNRVDFRQLAKDLGTIFKTRIELRQVGIRDKAKEIGGIGPCGRKLCCNNFLTEFDSVSINMAKNQNLSLNPTKINGVCGRLLCCLKYENDNYTEYKKGLPDVGHRVKTEKGEGKVISVDVFKKTYKVLLSENEILTVEVSDESKE
ncbi:MAG: stage 0 sporulation family protein [Bacilli bacterium]|nr:stage 0 sporulation family protein [Bacilli bacterium]